MKQEIKQIAVNMATQVGLINLTRSELCRTADIPEGSFSHVMGCTFVDFISELKADGVGIGNYAVSKRRVNADLRKEQILNAAVTLATTVGYSNLTKQIIAEHVGVSVSLVGRYFSTMTQLKRAVMRAAITQEIPEIIAQGLTNNDPHARNAPQVLKSKAADLIANY